MRIRGEGRQRSLSPQARVMFWSFAGALVLLWLLRKPALIGWVLPPALFGGALWWVQQQDRRRQEDEALYRDLEESLAELYHVRADLAADLQALDAYLREHPDAIGALERARLLREIAAIDQRCRDAEMLLTDEKFPCDTSRSEYNRSARELASTRSGEDE